MMENQIFEKLSFYTCPNVEEWTDSYFSKTKTDWALSHFVLMCGIAHLLQGYCG